MRLQDAAGKGIPQDAQLPVEWQYVEQHPDQRRQVLGYVLATEDPDSFRQDVQAALDQGKQIVFGDSAEGVLDELPPYRIE